MDRKAPKWMNRDFKPGFMVKLHLKDMKLALEAARELGVALPVSEKTTAMLQQLQDEGCGDEDNGALVKVLEKLAGVEVRQV
jgi:2-hydroxy-3-oxopropionate reductase